MSGFVPSRVVGSPALDDGGYPLNGYDEVVPGLAQADTTFTPTQLFDRGFDAVFDVCGWNRGDGVADRPYVFYLLDDVPWVPEPERIHQLGREIAALVLQGNRVAVNCAAGLNRSGLLVGSALVELGHPPLGAIELVRRARGPWALSNVGFTRFLLLEEDVRAEPTPPPSRISRPNFEGSVEPFVAPGRNGTTGGSDGG